VKPTEARRHRAKLGGVVEESDVVLAAVRADQGAFSIGDVLCEEIGNDDMASFRACAKYLAEQYDDLYKAKELRKLYLTAKQFPPAQRRQEIPWCAHAAAGTPQNLQPVIDGLKQLGWPMTEAFAESVAAMLRNEAPGKAYCERVGRWIESEKERAKREQQPKRK
jgi:hypothetical protein